MPVSFDHTIIVSADRVASALFYRELVEIPEAPSWGPFVDIQLADGVLLQFAEPPVDIQSQARRLRRRRRAPPDTGWR